MTTDMKCRVLQLLVWALSVARIVYNSIVLHVSKTLNMSTEIEILRSVVRMK